MKYEISMFEQNILERTHAISILWEERYALKVKYAVSILVICFLIVPKHLITIKAKQREIN